MLPDRVSNPGPLTYESGALPIALRGPANRKINKSKYTCISVFDIVGKARGLHSAGTLARTAPDQGRFNYDLRIRFENGGWVSLRGVQAIVFYSVPFLSSMEP